MTFSQNYNYNNEDNNDVIMSSELYLSRIFFSIFKQVGHFQEVEILPGVKRQMKTLSMRPLVFGKMEKQEVTWILQKYTEVNTLVINTLKHDILHPIFNTFSGITFFIVVTLMECLKKRVTLLKVKHETKVKHLNIFSFNWLPGIFNS